MNLKHPQGPAALEILRRLRQAGHRALLAGGCVRDFLLSRPAADLDVATSATPDQIEALFDKTVSVGKSFGVIRVLLEGADIEVATFRQDGDYKDGRHPESVRFSDEKEDALRRDFTINALFWDPVSGEVLDYVGGREDLNRRILRTVGDPRRRFAEDKLRLLRAVRFAVQLDFSIEEETWKAIQELAVGLSSVSGERVRDELIKGAKAARPGLFLRLLRESRLFPQIFPSWENAPSRSVPFAWPVEGWERAEIALARLLLPWGGGPGTAGFFDTWKGPRSEEKFLKAVWASYDSATEFWTRREGLRLRDWADPAIREGLLLAEAARGAFPERAALERRFQELAPDGVLPRALVGGDDLKGQIQGVLLGRALEEVYLQQLEGRFQDKEGALTAARAWLKMSDSGGAS